MPETTMTALMAEADRRSLIRKIKKATAWLAPRSVDLPETITGETGAVLSLPAGWKPVGLVTPDGYTFGRETDKEDITALGYASPVRSDLTSITRTVGFTFLEHGKRHLQELLYGMDMSGVTQQENGEIVFDEPDMPDDAELRLLVIGADGPLDNEWVLGRGFGTTKLAEAGEQVWGQEGAVQQEITLDVYSDDDLGTPVRHYLGGTGAVRAATELGYESA